MCNGICIIRRITTNSHKKIKMEIRCTIGHTSLQDNYDEPTEF